MLQCTQLIAYSLNNSNNTQNYNKVFSETQGNILIVRSCRYFFFDLHISSIQQDRLNNHIPKKNGGKYSTRLELNPEGQMSKLVAPHLAFGFS